MLAIIEAHADKVDGIKVSLLDAAARSRCAQRLPEGVRMYTGDDFNYPELIASGSDALLGHLRRDRARRGRGAARARRRRRAALRRACSRRPSRSPATSSRRPRFYYKTGVVFLAFLNGHQEHFRMVGGLESGRSSLHLAELFVLADRAGLLRDPELASARMRHVLALAGIADRPGAAQLQLDRRPTTGPLARGGIDACAEHGIEWSAPWRHKLAEPDVEEARRRDRRRRPEGLVASAAAASSRRRGADEDNRRAVEEAAALGARRARARLRAAGRRRTSPAARATIERGIERLLPLATEHGVRLGIEPLHPMMIGERSAIITLGEALDIAERIGDPGVGVVIDVYHTFWDPQLEAEHRRARKGRIVGYHVNDWLVPTTDMLARARDDGRRHHRPARLPRAGRGRRLRRADRGRDHQPGAGTCRARS